MTPQELLDLPQNTPLIVVKTQSDSYFSKGQVIYKGALDTTMVLCDDRHSVWCREHQCSDRGSAQYIDSDEVRLYTPPNLLKEQTVRPAEELGVFRPELESRKVGKVRVELVDDGFPLALREVAKVMTWAQTAKGYKDHDWQNLPNAEIALAAAASRHRTDHIKQRVVDGLDIDQCVDVESSLLHKAHEAFGVLAQLELMLRGQMSVDTGD